MNNMLIALLTSDAAIVLLVGAFVAYIVKLLKSGSGAKFKAYEGYAITAVKAAEQAIPDGTPNKGLAKADFALREFLKRYEKATGITPKAEEVAKVESWISEIHSALEGAGIL